MRQYFKRKLNPPVYQGINNNSQHFEGWYFKLINKDEDVPLVIIPGLFRSGSSKDSFTFIQIFDGRENHVHYFQFPIEDFKSRQDVFDISINSNKFTSNSIQLDLSSELINLQGKLHFKNLTPWPVSLISPGIMGWYAWVPFMECYHGIVSLDHQIEGSLNYNNNKIDFSGGRGYIEKDWGRAFPDAWIWMQSNHFNTPGISLTGSIAIIPWIKQPFLGYITGLWYDNQLHRFTTYLGSKIQRFNISDSSVDWALRNKTYEIELSATRSKGALLHAPTLKGMTKRIEESLDSTIKLKLYKIHKGVKTLVLEDTGRQAGLEIGGNLDRFLMMYKKLQK